MSTPFECINKNKIKFQCDIDKETDKNGNFKVRVSIANNLNEDISALILVDLSDEPIFNFLFPNFKDTMYCVGSCEWRIPANWHISETINCSFPKGSFDKKNYNITVEFAPYIPNGNINKLFGFIFFDMRWKLGIKPYYIVNESVQRSIRKLWYNLPLYYEDPEIETIFPAVRQPILYNGEPPIDIVENVITRVSKEVKSWIILFFFLSLLLIGFACIGYWIIRKKSI